MSSFQTGMNHVPWLDIKHSRLQKYLPFTFITNKEPPHLLGALKFLHAVKHTAWEKNISSSSYKEQAFN